MDAPRGLAPRSLIASLKFHPRATTLGVLALIVAIALALRLYGIDWDQGHLYHPDERSLLMRSNGDIRFPPLSDLSVIFDAEKSPLNPHWFSYGTLPMYTIKVIQEVGGNFTEIDLYDLRYIGRVLSTLSDIGIILGIFAIGSIAYGRRVGLLAAAFIALAVIHIQNSHFTKVDGPVTFFAIATLWSLLLVMRHGRLRDSALAGLFFGLAMGTKVSAAPLLLPILLAHAFYLFWPEGGAFTRPSGDAVRRAIKGLTLAGILALLLFFITNPYAILDLSVFGYLWDVTPRGAIDGTFKYWTDFELKVAREAGWVPYTQQYIDTPRFWYQVQQVALFGLGLPLGIVAWVGLLFTILVALRHGRRREDILLLAWVIPSFIIVGLLETKFIRFMLPLTPFILLMGARMLIWLWDAAKTKAPRLVPLAGVAIAFVLMSTAFCALAFVQIYNRPHTANRASQWIQENVPKGSLFLKEHWEEWVPGIADERHVSAYDCQIGYCYRELPMYDGDSLQKIELIAQQLAEADYIYLFSNRLYGTIPRLPERYPVSGGYYRLLFSGALGYELVRVEASYPSLLGVAFMDDTLGRPKLPAPQLLEEQHPAPLSLNLGYADESFTVYDHPKVLIFKRTRNIMPAEITDKLIASSVRTSGQEAGLMLSTGDWETQKAGGSWTDIVKPNGWLSRVPVIGWLALVSIISIVAFPIGFIVFRPLADRGYLLTKALSLLIVSYIPWMLASLHWMAFTRASVLLGLGLIFTVSLVIAKWRWPEMKGFIREKWRLVLLEEGIFLAAFMTFYLLRIANPDLWEIYKGGEKPMELAYLGAVLKSSYMPPYDPWFAGGFMNYYYYGYFMVASLIHVTGVAPAVAFNLAIPLFFALTGGCLFSVVYSLVAGIRPGRLAPVTAGLSGILFAVVIGNLGGAVQLTNAAWHKIMDNASFPPFDYWASTRLMPPDPPGHEITEFPFFTFLFADLHPHLMALPFTILVLGLGLALVLKGKEGAGWRSQLATLFFLGLAVSALRAINPWDFPTYLIIGLISVALGQYIRHRGLNSLMARSTLLLAVLLVALSSLLFLPFTRSYISAYSDLRLFEEPRTDLIFYLAIHGLFVFLALSFLLYEGRSILKRVLFWPNGSASEHNTGVIDPPSNPKKSLTDLLYPLIGLVALAIMVIAIYSIASTALNLSRCEYSRIYECQYIQPKGGYTTVIFLLGLFSLTGYLIVRQLLSRAQDSAPKLFTLLILGSALAIGIGVDLITLQGDRMNTVFKFYIQGWVLFSVASAVALARLDFGRALSKRLAPDGGPSETLPKGSAEGPSPSAEGLGVSPRIPAPPPLPRLWERGIQGVRAFRADYGKGLWTALLVLLIASSLVYTILGTRSRLSNRFHILPMTVDGMAYMKTATFGDRGTAELRWDYDAILWMQKSIPGSPVVLEAVTLDHDYRWAGRVSAYTGLPAVLGWPFHQSQQRGKFAWAVDQRKRDVETIYSTRDPDLAWELIERYAVDYIYIGQTERFYYPAEGLNKFDTTLADRLELVYPTSNQNPHVKIYRVNAVE